MRPNILQLELFPEFTPAGVRAPRLTLPWSEREEIDSTRAAKILGVSSSAMSRILASGCIRHYKLRCNQSVSRIYYESLVAYCDELRVLYLIPARAPRVPGRRLRDDQVLPFPLSETVTPKDVATTLRCSLNSVPHLIEEGELVAYRLIAGQSVGQWRIHLASLERCLERMHRMAERRTPVPSLRGVPNPTS